MTPNSALEQAASAARPWQDTQGKTVARGGPRPGPRPPLLTASVRRHNRRFLAQELLMPVLVFTLVTIAGLSPHVAGAQVVCTWEANLRPEQVVPPVVSAGWGSVIAHFDEDDGCPDLDESDALVIDPIYYDQLQGTPTGAEIRRGAEGTNGELILTIATAGFTPGSQFTIPFRPDTYGGFGGDAYVVLTTDLYPDGELRGQLVMLPTPVSNRTWGVVRALYR
jgi:hypothetical protein